MIFLYWNIHKNQDLFPLIQNIIIEREIDLLMIAEYPSISPYVLLNEINKSGYKYKYVKPIITNKKSEFIYSENFGNLETLKMKQISGSKGYTVKY